MSILLKFICGFACFYLFTKLSYIATDWLAFLWIGLWAIPIAGISFIWSAIVEGDK